jgi:DNA-binding IclR family transcriptional regulator
MLKTIKKAFAVIETIESRGPMRLTQLAKALDLDKSTARRLLISLEAAEYLQRDADTAKYALSLRFSQIGAGLLRSLEIRKVANQVVQDLWRSVDEAVNLAVLSHGKGLMVEKVGRPEPLSLGIQICEPFPLHSTGLGKVLLAYLPPERSQVLLRSEALRSFTRNTITEPKKLEAELATIRSRGYSWDLGETNENVRCVAAPIFNYQGEVVAALSVSAPLSRFPKTRMREIAPFVSNAGLHISERLGFRPPVRFMPSVPLHHHRR